MAFLKKLFNKGGSGGGGSGSLKDTAVQGLKAVGLDPAQIMPKIFAYFCGGNKNSQGNDSMDFGKLLSFAKSTGITDSKVTPDFLQGIFDKFKGDDGGVDYNGFQKGITKIAEKKYEDEGIKGDKAKSKLEQQIISDNDVSDWIE